MQYIDCVVIGGGAAGLMCAATAAKRGLTVKVLDHANKVGKKILMSGGGRCNFTNYYIEPENYLSSNSHFCKSALSRYTQYDFLELVGKYQLNYHEKTLGQLFCDNKAKDILNILLEECETNGVDVHTDCAIKSIEPIEKDPARFQLSTDIGDILTRSVVIATGGLSIPTMGATGFGYDIAKQFGLRIKPRYASLVPFTFKGELLAMMQSLAGVSLPITVECQGQSFAESLLFTHKGLSGPAMLQISNYWQPEDNLTIDFLPSLSLENLLDEWQKNQRSSEIKNKLSQYLPKRFVVAWLEANSEMLALSDKSIAEWSREERYIFSQYFHAWQCVPAGTEGYKTAEVTKGGVDTDGVSSKTFEAKKTPGLFFVGEVLDVTGWLGGYNFQWAWASGYCAAQYV